ncbi:MAG: hypothetical protein CTY12_00235 [Methylotenera sp.]|nr:MAG: hypothetical protein CTY12_00235 [Methylotenera sp.]
MAAIHFHKISLRNFLSYGNNLTVIELDKPGTTLIVGENLDSTSHGVGANGVGKTTIINAITYALYDKPISDISKDKLVNNINEKNMEVSIEFSIEDTEYTIKRTRKMKAGAAGNNVYLFVNGEDKTLDSATNTNNKIEEIIGIPYELFVRIVVYFASHKPFLDLPKADQTIIFERLVGLTMLSDKATDLKGLIKEIEMHIQIKKTKLDMLVKEHERHNIQLSNAKDRMDRWEENQKIELQTLLDQRDVIENTNFDQQQTLHDELVIINEQLTHQVGLSEKINQRIREYKRSLDKEQKELVHLKDNKCPYCLQQYGDAEQKIETLEEHVLELDENITTNTEELTKISDIIDELEIAKRDVAKLITVPSLKELNALRTQANTLEAKIDTLEKSTNPHIDSYQELLVVDLEEIVYDEVNLLTKELKHQTFLLKLLTKKDSFVRKELLNKYIPYLNSQLHYYLQELGLPHHVVFTHEMTANISQFGKELDFGNLSAGQKARVNLALSLAFSDVLQRLHTKINICLLDEVLDFGLDAIGAKAAIRLLKQRAKDKDQSMFIISHRDEIGHVLDRTMIIQMSKGFSYINEQT